PAPSAVRLAAGAQARGGPRQRREKTPPIVLNPPQAFRADNRGAEIGMWELRLPRHRALDRLVERDIDRLVRQLGLVVVVGGHCSLGQIPISSFHSSAVLRRAPAPAVALLAHAFSLP